MKAKIILTVLCILTLAAVISALAVSRHNESNQNSASHQQTFQVHGQIRAVDVAGKTVRIAHEKISNYMPAMIMPFPVKNVNILKGLSVGENVQFELVVTETDAWVSHIEKIAGDLPTDTSGAPTASTSVQNADVDRIRAGEVVPDFNLIDQDGRPIRLSEFRGKAVVLTFIYTRCPLPNFCPLMSRNFEELQQRLNKEFPGKYHLLSISMDPDFDRPEVLKDYAARYGANEKDWSFATGSTDQISFVAGLTGLYYARENGLIAHDFRTALIGPDGRLHHLWKSNVWTPYEVQRMVRKTFFPFKDEAAQ
ncbi:MAG: SCO family protein [Limisphaerales bacterium]